MAFARSTAKNTSEGLQSCSHVLRADASPEPKVGSACYAKPHQARNAQWGNGYQRIG